MGKDGQRGFYLAVALILGAALVASSFGSRVTGQQSVDLSDSAYAPSSVQQPSTPSSQPSELTSPSTPPSSASTQSDTRSPPLPQSPECNILSHAGFVAARQKGSHVIMRKETTEGTQ